MSDDEYGSIKILKLKYRSGHQTIQMNDVELVFTKLLKLKYRREDQKIKTFCKIGSPRN